MRIPFGSVAGLAYWGVFIGVFVAVAIWETLRPRRLLEWSVERRWKNHAVLLGISVVFLWIVLPVSSFAFAEAVSGNKYGVLNGTWLPLSLRWIAAILALDLVHYGTHRAFHALPWLWRIHRVHHSDPDYDVSTGGRFHPFEVFLTQGVWLIAIGLLAPPPGAVLAAQLMTAAANLLVHANASLPPGIERWLRRALVTPDLHRFHHSVTVTDQMTNFGQTFSFWDRVFRTLRQKTTVLNTGIEGHRNEESLALQFMLTEPFD